MIRNTLQRQIVLNAVNALTTHPTPDEIYEYINKSYPFVSKSTVYRNLNILADKGEILRINIPNAADRYDFNTNVHYHIVCNQCGRVDDIELKEINIVSDKITDSFGYDIEGYTIIFYGYCPECKNNIIKKEV